MIEWIVLQTPEGDKFLKRISSIDEIEEIEFGIRVFFKNEEEGYDYINDFNDVCGEILGLEAK